MGWHILGVMAATMAAPYLIVVTTYLCNVKASIMGNFTGAADLLPIGHFVLRIFGLPILALFAINAAILGLLDAEAMRWSVLGGAVAGLLGLAGLLALPPARTDGVWPIIFTFPLSGSICGSIYWIIAIGGRAAAPGL